MQSFTIPVKTYSKANARKHNFGNASAAKKERWATRLAWKSELGAWKPQLPCRVTMVRVAPRRLDDDNLAGALKCVRDELAALIGVDDRDKGVLWRASQARGKPKEYAVRVTLEEFDLEPSGGHCVACGTLRDPLPPRCVGCGDLLEKTGD